MTKYYFVVYERRPATDTVITSFKWIEADYLARAERILRAYYRYKFTYDTGWVVDPVNVCCGDYYTKKREVEELTNEHCK